MPFGSVAPCAAGSSPGHVLTRHGTPMKTRDRRDRWRRRRASSFPDRARTLSAALWEQLPASVAPVTCRAHDRDDLLHGRRIGRIALSLVTWRAASVKAGHGRRRPPTTGGVEQQLGRDLSSGLGDEPRASRKSHAPRTSRSTPQRESRFASVALAAAVLGGLSGVPRSSSEPRSAVKYVSGTSLRDRLLGAVEAADGLAWIHRLGRWVPSGRKRRMTSCAGL
jgi:hypothetical protein